MAISDHGETYELFILAQALGWIFWVSAVIVILTGGTWTLFSVFNLAALVCFLISLALIVYLRWWR